MKNNTYGISEKEIKEIEKIERMVYNNPYENFNLYTNYGMEAKEIYINKGKLVIK